MLFLLFLVGFIKQVNFFTSKIIKIYTNSKMMAAYTISAVGSSSPFHSKTTLRLDDNSNAMLSFLYKKERKQTNKNIS